MKKRIAIILLLVLSIFYLGCDNSSLEESKLKGDVGKVIEDFQSNNSADKF